MVQVSGLTVANPVKYLGSLSPSVFPLRTALDVLQPGLGLRFPLQFGGYGSPWSVGPAYPRYLPHFTQLSFLPANTGLTVERTPLPQVVVPAPADPVEAVDVAEEVVEEEAAPGEIVIRRPVDSLPSLPASPFRDQRPVIPAGIAQATQPTFVHTIFKVSINIHDILVNFIFLQNPKVAPSLQFVINSKISPVLQEISSGVEQL